MILAVITVVQCDDCERTTVLQTEPEYATYQKTWFVTTETQLCFLCREKVQVREDDAVLDEAAVKRAIGKMVRKYGAAEVVNAR